jgi:hypothetical protein
MRTPCEGHGAPGCCPFRRGGPDVPGGMGALDGDAHPVVIPPWREHRRAGTRSAQRRRSRAHAARPVTPPGAPTPAKEPSWRNRSRGSRRPHPAFLEEIPSLSRETAVGWLSSCRPPSGRSPRAAPPVALRFCHSRSSASTSCNHLSLAGVPSPSGEGRWITWVWRAARGRSPRPTGSISTPSSGSRTARGRSRWLGRPESRAPLVAQQGHPRGGDLGGMACEAAPCAELEPLVGPD